MRSRRVRGALVPGVLLVLLVQPLQAHHGSTSFDTTRELTLKATITEWVWAHPHCLLRFEAPDEKGGLRTWVAETQNPIDMSRRGWARDTFKPGDRVTLFVQQAKGGASIARIRTVILASGRTLGNDVPAPVTRSSQ